MAAPHVTRMGLAQIKEPVPDPLAAILHQKHGFGTVEDLVQREANRAEGLGEFVRMILHRGAGRGAHQLRTVESPHKDRAGAVAVGLQIVPLVVQRAVIEIGPVAEHRDPERGHIIQPRIQRGAGQGAHLDHAETCAIQSRRL